MQYDFIGQLVFNVGIGNTDAHAKNYSLLHHEDGTVTLSPLYDTVPIGMFPQYDQKLGMRIGNQRWARGVAPDNWVCLSKKANLDPDRVLDIVADVNQGILEHIDDTIGRTELARRNRVEFDRLRFTADRSLRLAERRT